MKKTPGIFFVLPVVAICLAPATSLFAAATGVPTKVATVTSVSTMSNTITINTGATTKIKNDTGEAHDTLIFKVDLMTTITVNGLKGTLADIKEGMKVDITRGMDRDVAATITAYGAPPALPTPVPTNNGKGKPPLQLGQPITAFKITSIGTDSITVGQDGGKELKAFQIDKSTQILINGQKAELGALQTGMKVQYRVGGDPHVLATLTATK